MAANDVPEGYPDSPADDLTPASAAVSLDDADRELEAEDLVAPTGARPPDSVDRDDAFYDAPDADVLAALEVGDRGSRPEDEANFDDNAAEWSRQRS